MNNQTIVYFSDWDSTENVGQLIEQDKRRSYYADKKKKEAQQLERNRPRIYCSVCDHSYSYRYIVEHRLTNRHVREAVKFIRPLVDFEN
jgi:hypothetical protein